MKTILKAVVGSHAYGLATPESDLDYQGVFVLPTDTILGIRRVKLTHSHTDGLDKVETPDTTMHEVGKFLSLALDSNPTINEVLWVDSYLEQTIEGRMLVDLREHFLSQLARKKYGGYAVGQLKRYQTPKQARHLMRLVVQGERLLATGKLSVRLDPGELATVREAERRATEDFEDFKAWATLEIERLDSMDSVLPLEPNMEVANDLLLMIRKLN